MRSNRAQKFLGVAVLSALVGTAYYRHILQLNRSGKDIYETSRKDSVPVSFRLTEMASGAGITHKYGCFEPEDGNRNVIDRLCAQSAVVAVADMDGDGNPDLFFTTMKAGDMNHLYRNRGDGTFEDVTKGSGLEDNNEVPTAGALWFDYDNDGLEDLLVLKVGCHKLYKNLGHGHFRDVSEETGINKICGSISAVNAFDFDRDGYLDLFIGSFVQGKDLKHPVLPSSAYLSDTGAEGFLLKNMGGRFFKDVTKEMGISGRHHTWAVGVSDFNHDGYPDLFLANDFGTASVLLNRGGKKFEDISTESGIVNTGRAAMNAEIGDLFGTGASDVYVSNISYPGLSTWGNSLWHASPGDHFQEWAGPKGIKHCGWGWGAKFVDLDRDGHLDIFATGGYWKGETSTSYYYARLTQGALPRFLQLDVDVNPPTRKYSLADKDSNCVFLQQKDGTFVDAGAALGMPEGVLGKAVAVIDSTSKGEEDVIVTRTGEAPFFYKNSPPKGTHWLGLKLVGTKSNRDAWGSVVRLESDVGTQYRELYPGNGFKSESDGRIFFGLGYQPKIKSLSILWPSGTRQEISSPQIDKYTLITETKGP